MNPSSNILLVEDNDDDAFLTRRALEAAGISQPIVRISNGQEAIDYLRKIVSQIEAGAEVRAPALVLLDLKMPQVTGLEVLSWIRQQEALVSLFVLVLTSSSEQRDVMAAYRHHVKAYLVKPTSQTDMVELARSVRQFWLEQNHLVHPDLNLDRSVGCVSA